MHLAFLVASWVNVCACAPIQHMKTSVSLTVPPVGTVSVGAAIQHPRNSLRPLGRGGGVTRGGLCKAARGATAWT